MLEGFAKSLRALSEYYGCLWYFLVQGRTYDSCPYFRSPAQAARKVYIYSLAAMFFLWSRSHYRNPSFQVDLLRNLRNVAVPGTGLPLSFFAWSSLLAYLFVWILYPLLSAIAATLYYFRGFKPYDDDLSFPGFADKIKVVDSWSEHFVRQLLEPDDWCSLWQLNCRLASLHSYLTRCPQYELENKWAFLQKATSLTPRVGVTPFNESDEAIVVKDRNEEGGMGVFIFPNAVYGGNWIIQPKFSNSPFIAELLPVPAPLSTFRVLTMSTAWVDRSETDEKTSDYVGKDQVRTVSCTFRAGDRDATTDHKSVLFPVNLETGDFGLGTTSAHWYRVGLTGVFDLVAALTTWSIKKAAFYLTSSHTLYKHPQANAAIVGKAIPKDIMKKLKEVSEDAHRRLLPDVPIIGWDVASTPSGEFLLEANLSCNFFRGPIPRTYYFGTVDRFFAKLDRIKRSLR